MTETQVLLEQLGMYAAIAFMVAFIGGFLIGLHFGINAERNKK